MSIGKTAAQASHASVGAFRSAKKEVIKEWDRDGGKKIVLAAESLSQLKALYQKAKKSKLSAYLVVDGGHTELRKGTITALGIGPDKDENINKITGNLKKF